MSNNQKKLLLLGLFLGVVLEGLDGMILSTAMPRIISDLDGLKVISWVFTAYMLTSTLSTPIYGKLSDLYGRKQFYIGGMALFVIASMLAGQAHSIEWLIFWRGVQGLGAGAMMPIAASIASDVFTGPDRGKIQGIISGGFGISSVLGPTLGGWITDGPGWRWAFYINAPLGAAVIILLLSVSIPAMNKPAPGSIKVDYLGAATLMLFTTSLLLGFVFGGDETIGWSNLQTLSMFGLALVSLLGFILAESRASDPIVPLSFFRNPIFVVINVAGFFVGAAMFGAVNYISYFIQGVQGESATSSGTTVTPMMIALVIGTVVGGQLMTKLGKYRVLSLAFMAVMTVGVAQLVLLDVHSGKLEVLLAMITLGFGVGGSFPIFIIALQNAFDQRFLGTITSLSGFFRQIGATVSTSILGSVLTSQLAAQVPERLKANLPGPALDAMQAKGPLPGVQILTSSEGLGSLRQGIGNDAIYNGLVTGLREALTNSLHLVFIGSLGIAVVALVVCFFVKEIPLKMLQQSVQSEGLGESLSPQVEEVVA
ncbi:MAG TPA: MDR family MFS transporter [Chloroflexia bacterium]|nr:MDR family MFS transporter [Chloroflexia bacterium]